MDRFSHLNASRVESCPTREKVHTSNERSLVYYIGYLSVSVKVLIVFLFKCLILKNGSYIKLGNSKLVIQEVLVVTAIRSAFRF